MGDVLPFRRKVKAPMGVAYQYPVGNRETLTLLFDAFHGWTGRLTLASGQNLNFNRWVATQGQVVAALLNIYQLREKCKC